MWSGSSAPSAQNGRPGGRGAGPSAGWQWNALDVRAWPEVPPEARLGVFQELRARYGALDTTSHRHEYHHLLDVTQTVLQAVGCVEDPADADAALGAVARQVVRRLEVLLRGQQSWEEAAAMAAKWRTQSAPDDLRDGFEAADAVRSRRAERARIGGSYSLGNGTNRGLSRASVFGQACILHCCFI